VLSPDTDFSSSSGLWTAISFWSFYWHSFDSWVLQLAIQ
jgi:hypothetical protein